MSESHICFGCSKPIGDMEPHIHIPLDEWAATQGLTPFGLDGLMTFPFCEPCTVKTDRGWQLEAHEVKA